MNKLVAFVAVLVSVTPLWAQQEVGGGFEAGGHLFTGAGWQRYRTENNTNIGKDVRGDLPGVIGVYADSNNRANRVNRQDDFKFFLDEVELDLIKHFGEGTHFRADLDFGADTLHSGARFANAGGANADHVYFLIEQAYATANVGIGKGMEVLLGRFNAPIGFESNDVAENDTIGRSTIYRALRPISFTGVKFYYPFSDSLGLHLFGANNGLTHDDGDIYAVDTDIPSGGLRLQYGWGEEGEASHAAWSGAFGQDHGNVKNGWTILGDIDWQWWLNNHLAVGGEGIFRQIDTRTAGNPNAKYYGGLINFNYLFSVPYQLTVKYAYAHDLNGTNEVLSVLGTGAQSLTGADQEIHEVFVAMKHPIVDQAFFRLEAGFTYMDRQGPNNQQIFSAGGGFAYHF